MYNDIQQIFDDYIKAAKDKEETFRAVLKTYSNTFPSKTIDELPAYLHKILQTIANRYNFEAIRTNWINGIKTDNEVFDNYLEAAIKSFQDNPQEGIDLLSEENKDNFYGQIYEGLFNWIGSKYQGKSISFPGIGTEIHSGDAKILVQGIDIGRYIEIKYSDDYMSIIERSAKESKEKYASTDQVYEQINADIQKVLAESVSGNYSTQWKDEYDSIYEQLWRNDVSPETDISSIAQSMVKLPMSLIFLFKNEGLWLSEVYAKIEPIVQDNADKIIKNKIGDRLKSQLWYSKMGGK